MRDDRINTTRPLERVIVRLSEGEWGGEQSFMYDDAGSAREPPRDENREVM
jgi:hypothetical protein